MWRRILLLQNNDQPADMDESRIEPGDEIRCPHCRRWHPVVQRHQAGTEYTRRMLYFVCHGGDYYGGQIGTPSRFPTRRPRTAA